RECFETGHRNPVCRPTPDDWCKAITEAEAESDRFATKFRRFYYRKLSLDCAQRPFGARCSGERTPTSTRCSAKPALFAIQVNSRQLGRRLLEVYDRLRPAAARIPRKVWAGACGVTAVLVFILLCLSFSGSTEPRRAEPDRPSIRGESTPRLWHEV